MIDKNKVDHSIFWDLWEESQLYIFIVGHIAIESVIIQLIEIKLSKPEKLDVSRLNFPRKVELGIALGVVDDKLSDLLKKINSKRNKYAHRIEYKMSFDEAYDLIILASQSGIEFTDGLDMDKNFAESVQNTNGLLIELLSNTFFILALKLEELGGDFLLS